MKKLFFLIFMLSVLHVQAQLTMSDVLRIGRMPANPYNINDRSYIDARDSLQLMGYPLMRFVPNTVAPSDKYYSFYFQKSGNDKEKLVMESQYYKVGTVQKIVFKISLSTSDIDQFNAMLRNAMNHPDFEMIGTNLYVNNFRSKPATGVREQLAFSKGYTSSGTGEMNIQVPIVYSVSYSREY